MRFAAFDADRAELSIEPRDLACDVRETIDAFRPIANAADVTIALSAPDPIPCHVDASAVHQALLNLLDNAVKHRGDGRGVWVSASRYAAGVEIVVEDDGPGIPSADADRIFEPFTRLDVAGTRRVPGAGIGLAVVREVAVAHGGQVWVERSVARGGARFVLRLPAGLARDEIDQTVRDVALSAPLATADAASMHHAER
jgi:signal transduction histidine kinase